MGNLTNCFSGEEQEEGIENGEGGEIGDESRKPLAGSGGSSINSSNAEGQLGKEDAPIKPEVVVGMGGEAAPRGTPQKQQQHQEQDERKLVLEGDEGKGPGMSRVTLSDEERKKMAAKYGLAKILTVINVGFSSRLVIASGSVLDFVGDVLVNAANTEGLGGGGVDSMFNRFGGEAFLKARRALPVSKTGDRIQEGKAVYTIAAGKLKSKFVIHAVGPDYGSAAAGSNYAKEDGLLASAYHDIVRISVEDLKGKGVETVGCCLLSAGIYAGDRNLSVILGIACKSLLEALFRLKSDQSLTVFLIAFTEAEISKLGKVSESVFEEFSANL